MQSNVKEQYDQVQQAMDSGSSAPTRERRRQITNVLRARENSQQPGNTGTRIFTNTQQYEPSRKIQSVI